MSKSNDVNNASREKDDSPDRSTKAPSIKALKMTPEEFRKWCDEVTKELIANLKKGIIANLNAPPKGKDHKGQPFAPASELAPDRQDDPAWRELRSSSCQGLDDQLRIDMLRSQVSALPVAEDYKSKLLHSIDTYRDQILARPEVPIDGGWDDLEAIQQVALGDMAEDWFHKQRENGSIKSATNRLHFSGVKMDEVGTLLEALRFAADKHRGQRRKDGGTAYINHPIAVAHKLKHIGGIDDAVVLCSAILHDTLEDTETTKDELAAHFGEEIAEVVLEVTDDLTLKADKNRKAERKQMEIDHAPKLSYRAKLVKMADKICNAEDTLKSPPANWSIEERRGYIDWAKQVIDGMRGTNKALEAEFDELFATHHKGKL